MFKLSIISLILLLIIYVHAMPQTENIEVGDQTINRVNEAENDYKFSLEDGHERQQQRKEVDGSVVVIGFYKYIDPDGKERQIYYKADKKGYQVSYDKPFDFRSSPNESERLSSAYLPPSQNLIRDVLSSEYLPPNNQYLPPSK